MKWLILTVLAALAWYAFRHALPHDPEGFGEQPDEYEVQPMDRRTWELISGEAW